MRRYGQVKGRKWRTAQPVHAPSPFKGMRRCSQCGQVKPLGEFYFWIDNRSSTPHPRWRNVCKVCDRESACVRMRMKRRKESEGGKADGTGNEQ